MPSPFPGMDPHLEHPALWADVHNTLIVELRRYLAPKLRPRYAVRLEERTYLDPEGLLFVGRPDLAVQATHRREPRTNHVRRTKTKPAAASPTVTVTVAVPVPDQAREAWLEVRAVPSGEVVTVLEILSPSNKRPGPGRTLYEEKRMAVLGTRTHLVEIDLLRGGTPMPFFGTERSADYRVLVSRGDQRPRAELHLFSVRQPLPTFALPLRAGDREPEIRLRAALDAAYDSASYDLTIDYRSSAVPPLSKDAATWASSILTKAGGR